MNDSNQLIKDEFEKLPKQLKDYISGKVWLGEVKNIAQKFNLSEEDYSLLENEVFYTILGLEPIQDFQENIERELELELETAEQIDQLAHEKIFDSITTYLQQLQPKEKQEEIKHQPVIQHQIKNDGESGVGQSFAQAIVNQAKAMRPIQQGRDTSYEARETRENKIPDNLPTGDKPNDHISYEPNKDPYREPLE